MTIYEKIRQIRNEKFPPELEGGCEIIYNSGPRKPFLNAKILIDKDNASFYIAPTRYCNTPKKIYIDQIRENLGKSVSLNDVLRLVIGKVNEITDINLSKSIEDQDEKVLKQILQLIE